MMHEGWCLGEGAKELAKVVLTFLAFRSTAVRFLLFLLVLTLAMNFVNLETWSVLTTGVANGLQSFSSYVELSYVNGPPPV